MRISEACCHGFTLGYPGVQQFLALSHHGIQTGDAFVKWCFCIRMHLGQHYIALASITPPCANNTRGPCFLQLPGAAEQGWRQNVDKKWRSGTDEKSFHHSGLLTFLWNHSWYEMKLACAIRMAAPRCCCSELPRAGTQWRCEAQSSSPSWGCRACGFDSMGR